MSGVILDARLAPNCQASDSPRAARVVGQTCLPMRSIDLYDRCPERTARHGGVLVFDPDVCCLAASGPGKIGSGKLAALGPLGEHGRKGKFPRWQSRKFVRAGDAARFRPDRIVDAGVIGAILPPQAVLPQSNGVGCEGPLHRSRIVINPQRREAKDAVRACNRECDGVDSIRPGHMRSSRFGLVIGLQAITTRGQYQTLAPVATLPHRGERRNPRLI
jgi:hypothetical protein